MATSDLKNRFTFHPATPDKGARYDTVRGKCLELAQDIDALVPDSREKALALTNLEQAMFWANAAIARN